jgi:pimeloyl-ACP methyl ester carboxylesterase
MFSFRAHGMEHKARAQRCLVFLHGIGSSAASWDYQFDAVSTMEQPVIALAWDAPGYGQSDPLLPLAPTAAQYASAMWTWLDGLGVSNGITLVGHSLGCLMAGAAALQRPASISQLVLLAPALGYGRGPIEKQEVLIHQRLDTLAALGPAGMAQHRAAALLSAHANASVLAKVQESMARLRPDGYAQAVHMLAQSDLLADLAQLQRQAVVTNILVACGSQDTITPPEKCLLAAQAVQRDLIDLGPVGHACALEGAQAVNHLLGLSRQ